MRYSTWHRSVEPVSAFIVNTTGACMPAWQPIMRVRRIDDIQLLTIIIALVFGAIGVSMPLLTLYLQSLGADYAHIALILATTAAVGLGSSYLWGRVTDALGRRKPLIAAGLAVTGVAYLLLSRVTTPGHGVAGAARRSRQHGSV